jgi:transposase
MITIETWAYIRRLYLHDGVSISAIASELGLDRKTVRRAIRTENFLELKNQPRARSSKLDPFKPAIARMLEKTPHLSGVRILEKLRPLGYTGGKSILNEYLATLPQRQQEVYLRIETGPGEQAQCDWGQCGALVLGKTKRLLSCFVMTLAYSRFMYVRFYLAETMENFLACPAAGQGWSSARLRGLWRRPPNHCLRQPQKRGPATSWQNHSLQSHASGLCRLLSVQAGTLWREKATSQRQSRAGGGFCEKQFARRPRRNLFATGGVNHECGQWLAEVNNRIHGATHQPPVERLAEERAQLLPLPPHPYDIARKKPLYADRQAFVHFESNLYSVPPEAVGHPLTLKATPYQIDIYHHQQLVASHPRSFEKHRVFEKPEHRHAILRQKRQARQHKQRDFFLALGEGAEKFLAGLTLAGARIPYHLERIMQMVDVYGKTEVLAALARACEYGAYHCEYVENMIQQCRDAAAATNPKTRPSLKHGHCMISICRNIKSKARTMMNKERLEDHLTYLQLVTLRRVYEEHAAKAARDNLSYLDFLERPAKGGILAKKERAVPPKAGCSWRSSRCSKRWINTTSSIPSACRKN